MIKFKWNGRYKFQMCSTIAAYLETQYKTGYCMSTITQHVKYNE